MILCVFSTPVTPLLKTRIAATLSGNLNGFVPHLELAFILLNFVPGTPGGAAAWARAAPWAARPAAEGAAATDVAGGRRG